MNKASADNWQCARPPHRANLAPERAIHFGLLETGSRTTLNQLPADFAERVHEQKVLTSPGVAEGFDHATEIIEGWKKLL